MVQGAALEAGIYDGYAACRCVFRGRCASSRPSRGRGDPQNPPASEARGGPAPDRTGACPPGSLCVVLCLTAPEGAAVVRSWVCDPCARCRWVGREGCPASAYPQRVPLLLVCRIPCLGSVLNAPTLCCCAARSRSSIVTSASRPAAAGPPRVPEGCISLIAGLLLAARSSETVSRAQHGQSVSERQAAVCGLPGALAVLQPACCRQGARPRPAGVGRRPVARGQPGAGRRWRGCHGKSGFIFPIRSPCTVSSEISQGCYL